MTDYDNETGLEREIHVSEKRKTKADAAAEVIGEGFKALVLHNRQLMQAAADKDAILMQCVAQALQERAQFWKFQEAMTGKFTDMIETVEKLKDRTADREEKRDAAKANREFKERALQDVRQLATVAVNQFAKRPILKESERGLVTELVESLDDDQITKLQEILRPSQMVSFAKVVTSLKEQEDKESGNGADPEVDSAPH